MHSVTNKTHRYAERPKPARGPWTFGDLKAFLEDGMAAGFDLTDQVHLPNDYSKGFLARKEEALQIPAEVKG